MRGSEKCLRLLASGLLISLGLAGCTDPGEDIGLAPPLTGVVSGDAVILAPLDAPHPVVLFLTQVTFDATGTPQYETVNLTVIPEAELFEGESDSGMTARTGEFMFPQVGPGLYVVTGIVDVDENFNPLVAELATATEPDIRGAYADLATGEPIVFELSEGEVAGEISVVFSS